MTRRAAIVGAAVVAIVALGLWLLCPGDSPEPIYRGKTSAWLDDCRATPQGPVVLSDEAVAAVRAIGTRALPDAPGLALRDGFADQSERQDPAGTAPEAPVAGADERGKAEAGDVRLPGPRSRRQVRVPRGRRYCVEFPRRLAEERCDECLARLRRRHDECLACGLKSPDRKVRHRAVVALYCIRLAPDEVTLPVLEEARNDPDPLVRVEAAKGIAQFNKDLKDYAARLTLRDPQQRVYGARSIGGYRALRSGISPRPRSRCRRRRSQGPQGRRRSDPTGPRSSDARLTEGRRPLRPSGCRGRSIRQQQPVRRKAAGPDQPRSPARPRPRTGPRSWPRTGPVMRRGV